MECQKCHTDNPIGAKYCRKCGRAFDNREKAMMFLQTLLIWITNIMRNSWEMVVDMIQRLRKENASFTPDTFKSIKLCPRSMVSMKFIKKSHWICSALFAILFYLLTEWNIIWDIVRDMVGDDVYLLRRYAGYVAWLPFALSIWFLFLLIRDILKKTIYFLNVDYMEEGYISTNIVRVAKNNKLGLFDKETQRILLWARYDDISKMDASHLLLSKGSCKGLYSLTYKKVIVPIKYTRISSFTNYVTTATNADGQDHYDIKGNKLK